MPTVQSLNFGMAPWLMDFLKKRKRQRLTRYRFQVQPMKAAQRGRHSAFTLVAVILIRIRRVVK